MLYKSSDHVIPYLEKLGLIKREVEIYILLADSCPLSTGEIQQSLPSTELLEVAVSLRNMKKMGIIGSTKGDLGRFYAKFLFLREAIDIEKETIFNLNTLVKSTEESHLKFKKKETRLKKKLASNLTKPLFETISDKFQTSKVTNLEKVSETHKEINNAVKEILENSSNDMEKFFLQTSEKVIKILEEKEEKIQEDYNLFSTEFAEDIASRENEMLGLIQKEESHLQERNENLLSIVKEVGTDIEVIHDKLQKSVELSESLEAKHLRLLTEVQEYQKKIMEFKADFDLKLVDVNKNVKAINDELIAKKKVNTKQVRKLISSAVEMSNLPFRNLTKSFRSFDTKINIKDLLFSLISGLADISTNKLTTIKDEIANTKLEGHITLFRDLIGDQFEKFKTSTDEKVNQTLNKYQDIISANNTEIDRYRYETIGRVEELFSEVTKRINVISTAFERSILILEEKLKVIPQEERDTFVASSTKLIITMVDELMGVNSKKKNLLKDEVKALTRAVEKRSADIKGVVNAAHTFKARFPINTGIVYGKPTILASLSDLMIRSRNKIIIIIPEFDEAIFNLATTLSTRVRVSIISKFPRKHIKKIIHAAQEIGTITLFDYQACDIFAGFKDDDEIVFGFNSVSDEKTAVRSTEELMIQLFVDRLNQTIRREAVKLN